MKAYVQMAIILFVVGAAMLAASTVLLSSGSEDAVQIAIGFVGGALGVGSSLASALWIWRHRGQDRA